MKNSIATLYFFCLFQMILVSFASGQDPCSQINFHAFKAENFAGEYMDLGTLGTEIETNQIDDASSEPYDIGFTFEFQCTTYTQFIFNTNGFIKLGAEPLSAANIFYENGQSNSNGIFDREDSTIVNLVVAFNHDLDAGADTPDFRVHTSGSAPNRICTIQWKNMREWTAQPETKQYDNMEFQIKLYETTNVIEFVYGNWDPSVNISNYKTAACGIKGKSAEDDQLLVVIKNSSAPWDNVVFQNKNYATTESFNFGNPPERPKPDVGRTYRFTPTYQHDLSVREVYALQDASFYYSSPQTISANIRNSGFNTQSDIRVTLEIWGANTFKDTQFISGLAFGENTTITFSEFIPTGKGTSNIFVSVDNDDFEGDNYIASYQLTDDSKVNYSSPGLPSGGWGFLAGVQGIYYVKYPVHGNASINSVDVYIANDATSVDETVFAAVLNEAGEMVGRSEDYVIRQEDLGGWHHFSMPVPPVISDEYFYAGFGMKSSSLGYEALGVQQQNPPQENTYYKSLITGSGLVEMDLQDFAYRFMIGATLAGTEPVAGFADGDASVCAGETTQLFLEGYSGFIQWQESQDGLDPWTNVNGGTGSTSEDYVTGPLNTSTYYRAQVSQPGFGPVYSNIVFVEVVPDVPVISQSGDVLTSSAADGNQWYNENGLIPGATGQIYFVTVPGEYSVVVTAGNCSATSNSIKVLSVGVNETEFASSIRMYPNPVKGELFVEDEDDQADIAIEIINLLGHVIYKDQLSESKVLNLEWINSGVYYIKFTRDGSVVVRKLVKE